MHDTTVIMGYGVKMSDLMPLLDMEKLAEAANLTMGTEIDLQEFEGCEDEASLVTLDYELVAATGTYGLCCFFQELGLQDLDFWENAHDEFFLLYARHFRWEESIDPPKSKEEVKARVAGVLLPFAKDGITAADIVSYAYEIEDIY